VSDLSQGRSIRLLSQLIFTATLGNLGEVMVQGVEICEKDLNG
jgi:hypothetical protein